MGLTKEQVAKNKQDILNAAERLFRTKGVDGVGLAELMAAAGFSHGGFYNHFSSKEDLVAEVMERAMATGAEQLDAAVAQSETRGIDPLARQLRWYLSPDQRDDLDCGCPLAGFADEAAHLRGRSAAAYCRCLSHTCEVFETLIRQRDPEMPSAQVRRKSIAIFSMMVGAVMLSRATVHADQSLASEILKESQAFGMETIMVRKRSGRAVGNTRKTAGKKKS